MPEFIEIYNACSERCDMLVGPCCCGAWHSEDEAIKILLDRLRKYNRSSG